MLTNNYYRISFVNTDSEEHINSQLMIARSPDSVSVYVVRTYLNHELVEPEIRETYTNGQLQQWINKSPMFNAPNIYGLIHFFVEECGLPKWLEEFLPYI